MTLEAPSFSDSTAYGQRLGNVEFWAPYVRSVLERHGFSGDSSPLETGFVGTYPTLLAGDVVIKLFGHFPGWRDAHRNELAMHQLLTKHPEIPAPALVGFGALYDGTDDSWPYLVTQRMAGLAWRDARLDRDAALNVAGEVGRAIRLVHDLELVIDEDWPAKHSGGAVDRHRRWRTLPSHLIRQISSYVGGLPDPGERRLLHADLTADHIFVANGSLTGIIDWGDAMATDRYYELGALHFELFQWNKSLLRSFLDGYGWVPCDGFPQHALGMALLHQFDLLGDVDLPNPDLEEYADLDHLDELAIAVFGV